jgi:hypothetical protein
MGNKVTIQETDGTLTTLTGRQLKAYTVSIGKSQGSKLLLSLIKRI